MPRIQKLKQVEPSLQPWNHQQQHSNLINQTELIHTPFNPEIGYQQNQYNHTTEGRGSPAFHRFNQSMSRNAYSRQQSRSGNANRKYSIDFVKKNQQNLKSYHCMSQNYSSLFNDDVDNFMPLNPNCALNQYLKRPTINTTYIGYYEEQPFFIQTPVKPRHKKQGRKSKSIETRPRTSDTTTIFHESDNRRNEQKQIDSHFYDRATLSVGGYHLQKMLKIKQKLRQKLKRNSEKKDIQRGLYVKSTMKIEQQKNSNMQKNNSFMHKRSPSQSRKSSKTIENNQKDKIRVDKWKEYIRLQNQNKCQQKNEQKGSKNNNFFAVLGGSIYK